MQSRLTSIVVMLCGLALTPAGAVAQSLANVAAPRPLDVFQLPQGFAQQTVATGLTGASGMAVAPDGRVFICEQTGALRVVKNDVLLPEPFVQLEVDSYWERGLLGVTLDPDFLRNNFIYVCYVAARPYPHHRVSRFTAEGDRAAPGSEVLLLAGDDQRKLGGSIPAGHQGGGIHFGADGKLYIGIGEQTAGAPAQRLDTFQGKLLRINADGSIPTDNPFITATNGKYRAIWAVGLRNPFGFSVQPGTGRLFINDVGGSRWEEINEGFAGANYGWPLTEGPTTNPQHRSPIHAYGEGNKKSITGGTFYNPARMQFPEDYRGKYFFAEYILSRIFTLDSAKPQTAEPFAADLNGPVDLRVGLDGSLYVLNRNVWVKDDKFQPRTGSLHRIIYSPNYSPEAPRFTTQPRDVTIAVGEPALFQATATGNAPLQYRWRVNGKILSGVEGPSVTLPSAQAADNAARVECIVSNALGTIKTQPARLWVTPLLAAPGTRSLVTGLESEYHVGKWPALPEFEPATRQSFGVMTGLNMPVRKRDEHFAVTYRGFLDIERDGAYTFRLRSEGASKLFITNVEVASVGFHNGPRDMSGTVGLRAGKHPFRLDYAHDGTRPILELRYSGPQISEQVVPESRFFHIDRGIPAATDVFQTDRTPREFSTRQLVTTLNVPADPADLPPLLSQTGIFRSLDDLTPHTGIIPYEVNSPLWSDGAAKRRWIALRGDSRIGFSENGAWRFPAGTVFIKHFESGDDSTPPQQRRRLETRLLVIDRDGAGYGVTYKWRDDQRDAELLQDMLTEAFAFNTAGGPQAKKWTYPSRKDCLVCHTSQAGFVLGVNTRQLNGEFTYPGSSTPENQLRAWSRLGLLDRSVPEAALQQLPRLSAMDDSRAPLAHRVRSYLDANCSQCHRPGGVRGEFDARFEVPLERQQLIGGKLTAADLGIDRAQVVAPGDRQRSMIYQRMQRRQDVFNMPPLATHEVDAQALEVVGRWIDSLKGSR